MPKSIRATTKKKRGRPKTTGPGIQVGVRLQPTLLAALDRYTSEDAPGKSRPEAIRELLEDKLIGLGLLPIEEPPR
jgi:hypothetical protein